MSKPLHICPYPGCPEIVKKGYCAKHKSQIRKEHDFHQDWQRLYDTSKWKRIRRIQLTNEPWCAECLRANIYTPATECDHVYPHRGDPVLFFRGPFQSLCKTCHSRKTADEVNGGRGSEKSGSWGSTSVQGE